MPAAIAELDAQDRERITKLFDRYEEKLDLTQPVIDTGKEILENAMTEELIDKRGYNNAVAAALFLACRECNLPRISDEFAALLQKRGTTALLRQVKKFKTNLDIKSTPVGADRFVDRFAAELDVNRETRQRAHHLVNIAERNQLTVGPQPSTVAAGALYAAAQLTDETLYQSEIAEVAHVTELKISEHYREQLEAAGESTD